MLFEAIYYIQPLIYSSWELGSATNDFYQYIYPAWEHIGQLPKIPYLFCSWHIFYSSPLFFTTLWCPERSSSEIVIEYIDFINPFMVTLIVIVGTLFNPIGSIYKRILTYSKMIWCPQHSSPDCYGLYQSIHCHPNSHSRHTFWPASRLSFQLLLVWA